MILAEPTYVAELRQGAAFRALRRIGILARLNRVIEEALDSVLSGKFLRCFCLFLESKFGLS